jgi:hypothetical protein
MRRVVAGALAAPILALSCTSSPPVSTTPGPADLMALHGEWVGTYEADVAHGRSGAILFRLDATEEVVQGCGLLRVRGRETAEGIPWEGDIWAHVPPERLILTTFVRGPDGTVDGNFAPFSDPVCGCQVTMTFNGAVRGNVMEGTYVLEHLSGAERATGKWRVTRRAAG